MPSLPIHLKVEINCKEHFSVLPMVRKPFEVKSLWYEGSAELLTYQLDELVGTKLRALYQRLKGRDLYDLYKALTMANLNVENVIHCYREYMAFVVDHSPTYKEYVLNMEEKMKDTDFLGDTKNLLRLGDTFDPFQGYEIVKSNLIDRLQS